jgi:hypothetical protein
MKKTYMSTLNKTVSARYQETSEREKKAGKKLKREDCGKMKEFEIFHPLMHVKW